MKHFNATADTTVSTGSGVLLGRRWAPPGYIIPTAAGVVNDDYTEIRIESENGLDWEVTETSITVSGSDVYYNRDGDFITSSTGERISFRSGVKKIIFTISEKWLNKPDWDDILLDSNGNILLDSNDLILTR